MTHLCYGRKESEHFWEHELEILLRNMICNEKLTYADMQNMTGNELSSCNENTKYNLVSSETPGQMSPQVRLHYINNQ
jgi:hypothetical protein